MIRLAYDRAFMARVLPPIGYNCKEFVMELAVKSKEPAGKKMVYRPVNLGICNAGNAARLSLHQGTERAHEGA